MGFEFGASVKRHLRDSKAYSVAGEIKQVLRRAFVKSTNVHQRVISLEPPRPSRGNVLLSYHIQPFCQQLDEPSVNHGPNFSHGEALQMATTFLEFGYAVDAISWVNDNFIPKKDYSVFVDIRHNLERIAPLLDKDCLKIFHADMAHWVFNNLTEMRRLLELQQRRKTTLAPRRIMRADFAIEHADCATVLGNDYTISTYRYADKPMYRLPRVPILPPTLYPSPEGKDFEACRTRFLWLGGHGLVHKGLDLVLDAFAEMPDCHLTVCGPVTAEEDFERVYFRELYETPNIHTIGWVDSRSPQFIQIMTDCLGLIHPSCAEGQAGAVVAGMHGGLIPIASCESGVDIDDFGVVLENCSVAAIKDSVRMVASLPIREMAIRARKAWEFARANHTREKFAQEFHKTVSAILRSHGTSPS